MVKGLPPPPERRVSIRRDASATGAGEFPDARGVLLRERGELRRSILGVLALGSGGESGPEVEADGMTPSPPSLLLGHEQERLVAQIPLGSQRATAVRPSPLQGNGLTQLPPFALASVEEDLESFDPAVRLR